MKKSILSLMLAAGAMAACQNQSPEQKIDSLATAPDTVATNNKSCYSLTKNRDTISLSMVRVGNAVTGTLDIAFYQKDKNTGTIAGLIKGDTIIADYTFMSEGGTSVREIAFVKKGDQLADCYGPSQEKNGKTVFTNPGNLKADDYTVLSPIQCK